MAILPIYIASLASLANCFQTDLQFVGCFLYFENTTAINHGEYIQRNLSHITCFQECQMTLNWTSSLALARQTMCLCDSNLEDFEKTKKVQDERCLSKCKGSLIDTKYCGQQDTMAVYAVSSASSCTNLSEPSNGVFTFDLSTVRLHCNEGHMVSDNDHLHCQRVNGSWQWSGPVPYCKENTDAIEVEKAVLPTVWGILITLLIVLLATGGIALGYLYNKKKSSFPWKGKFEIEQIYGENIVNETVIGVHTPPSPPMCPSTGQESTRSVNYENICSPPLPPTTAMHYWCDVSITDNTTHGRGYVADYLPDNVLEKFSTQSLQSYGDHDRSVQYTIVETGSRNFNMSCKSSINSTSHSSTSSPPSLPRECSMSKQDPQLFIKCDQRSDLCSTYMGPMGKPQKAIRSASVPTSLQNCEEFSMKELNHP